MRLIWILDGEGRPLRKYSSKCKNRTCLFLKRSNLFIIDRYDFFFFFYWIQFPNNTIDTCYSIKKLLRFVVADTTDIFAIFENGTVQNINNSQHRHRRNNKSERWEWHFRATDSTDAISTAVASHFLPSEKKRVSSCFFFFVSVFTPFLLSHMFF